MDTKSNNFRSPSSRRYLKGLFFETTLADKTSVSYTLKEHDHQGYPSLYRLYMEEKDPTEYRFATKYLDGWSHWEELLQCTWFQPHIAAWRRELELYIKSQALVNIFEEAVHPEGKNFFHANKYLLERGWIDKTTNTKGRPSKQDIKQEATRLAKEHEQVEGDYDRLIN
jgi:hypothetical protein